ncbi:MAG: lipoate--protein ligase family protein [Bacteroidales bacterium]
MSGAILETYNPFFNLALEDFLLHERDGEYCLLYFNDPSVIVGRHQVIYRETDIFVAESLKIPIIRRISGGGTVYHDRGNLNFTVIRNSPKGKQVDFALHTRPVIEFLRNEGVEATLSGKSDITVDGLKISGNAEHVYRERVLHHGTLLFDTSLETMNLVIRNTTEHYSTKAIESNRIPVINLKGKISNINSADELARRMFDYLSEYFREMEIFKLTEEEKADVDSLADSRYRTWEWNHGFSPSYEFRNCFEADGIKHTLSMYVRDGIIWKCSIEGSDEMAFAAKQMIGCRHIFDDIKRIFELEHMKVDDAIIRKFF